MAKKIDYNKAIYGEPKYSPKETVEKLITEKCIHNNRVMVYPEWFKAAEIFEALNAGVLKSKTHGRATYSHSELYLA